MKTLQEKYNAIQQGNFSKEQFLVEARMQQPQLVTRFNGYNDAVQILKNRGMIKEASSTEESFKDYSNDALSDMIANLSRYENNEGEIELVKQELARRKGVVKEEAKKELASVSHVKKLVQAAKEGNEKIDNILAGFSGAGIKYKVTTAEPNVIKWHYDRYDANLSGEIKLKPEQLDEARLTKNNLTDYRYKPTNEMDKYPYEQILRGLRVELEIAGVQNTPTQEQYAKALAKVSKNLAKDSIFYTNQLAGSSNKVDLHDKMVAVTAKNTVDTFNGMKKVKELKEDHTKDPDDKYTVKPCKDKKEPWAVWEGEKRVKGFTTKEEAKEYADKQNKKQGLTESVLKEGIKNLIKKALMENEEDIYEMQGPKTDDEYKSELADYLEDNQIYGYTNRIHNIMTGPDEDQSIQDLADFLQDNQIYGYNKAIESIYADYPYDQHYMNQPDEDGDLEEGMDEGYDEDKIAKYEQYTYTLDGKVVEPEIAFFNNYIGAELDGQVYRVGIPDETGTVELRSYKGKTGMYTEDIFESVSLKDIL